jgi:hypothetical protein
MINEPCFIGGGGGGGAFLGSGCNCAILKKYVENPPKFTTYINVNYNSPSSLS